MRSLVAQVCAVLACLVVLVGCGQKNLAEPQNSVRSDPTATNSAPEIDFSVPAAASGCPSKECSDILNMVAEGAKTDVIPADLTPSVAESAKAISVPPGGECSQLPLPGMKEAWQPCIYPTGAKPDAPLIVVIGDSQAWMWSTGVVDIAKSLGYRAAAVHHAGCHMPDVTFPTTSAGVTDEDCRAWKDAAINWVNQQKPSVVLVASGYSNGFNTLTVDDYVEGYVANLRKLAMPERKVFVMGDVPRPRQDPPRCLAANGSSALRCATRTRKAAPVDQQQAAFDAAQKAQAGYVNLTPLACTAEICPAISGNYAVYQNQYHFTTAYVHVLAPVVGRVLDLVPA